MRVNQNPDFPGSARHVILTVKGAAENRSLFAVGAPARRGRDGNGKIAVRGGEAMAAKRTTAQGGFAQRNAAPDFARQTPKAGPMTGQPGFAGRNATEWEQGPGRERKPRVGKEESPPLSRGRLRNLPMALLS